MNPSQHTLVEGVFPLQRFPGKGGWTYVLMPENTSLPTSHFGMVAVDGTIDDVTLKFVKLMPMGNGQYFLPVSARLRKQLKKEEGHQVRLALHMPNAILKIPNELLLCLEDESDQTKSTFEHMDPQIKQNWLQRMNNTEKIGLRTKIILDLIAYLKR